MNLAEIMTVEMRTVNFDNFAIGDVLFANQLFYMITSSRSNVIARAEMHSRFSARLVLSTIVCQCNN